MISSHLHLAMSVNGARLKVIKGSMYIFKLTSCPGEPLQPASPGKPGSP